MANITGHLGDKLIPVRALFVYKTNSSYNTEYYLENRIIADGKIGAGTPMQEEHIIDVVEFFQKNIRTQADISGLIPANMLGCDYGPGNKILIWYREPEKRAMHFTDALHIPSGIAQQPGLIYIANGSHLSVLAYKGKGRPTAKTALFSPPYHNCQKEGSVCLGSAKVKKPSPLTYLNVMAYFETMFWATEFSHLAGGASPVKGNVNTYWKQAIKSKKVFDESIMLPVRGLTLEKLIKKYIKNA